MMVNIEIKPTTGTDEKTGTDVALSTTPYVEAVGAYIISAAAFHKRPLRSRVRA